MLARNIRATSRTITVSRVQEGPLYSLSSSYYSRALIEHAKAVPGIRYIHENATHFWRGHVDAVRAVCARLQAQGVGVEGVDLLPAPDSWRTSRTSYLFSTQGLRDYQVEGVRFLIARSKEGALLADGMRLGKSLQALITARAFKQKTLIVCPAHVVGVWGRPKNDPHGPGEIAKWWPDAWRGAEGKPGVVCLESVKPAKAQAFLEKATTESKSKPSDAAAIDAAQAELIAFADGLKSADVIICHYDILYAWVHVLLLWGLETLILDEIHIVSGWHSRRSGALKILRSVAHRCIGLTGTPVTNLPRHTHNLLEILSPGRFGFFFLPDKEQDDGTMTKRASYARLYCGSYEETVGSGEAQKTVWKHDRKLNLDEPDGEWALTPEETLSCRLKHLMLRRLKRDVDPQLPQKTRQIVDVTIPARQMIGVSEKLLGSGKELRTVLNLAADGKLKSVVALVADHAAEGEKVVCFCYRRLFAERVVKDLKKKISEDTLVVFTHGGLSQKERERRIAKVRAHNGPAVLACTIDTTSTGIDLSFASVAVFGELSWEHHDLAQAEERLYEFGKDAKALIQYVIARGTGDELILRAVIDKLDSTERTGVRPEDSLKEDLAGNKEDSMKKLYAALVAMQKATGPGPTRPIRSEKRSRRA